MAGTGRRPLPCFSSLLRRLRLLPPDQHRRRLGARARAAQSSKARAIAAAASRAAPFVPGAAEAPPITVRTVVADASATAPPRDELWVGLPPAIQAPSGGRGDPPLGDRPTPSSGGGARVRARPRREIIDRHPFARRVLPVMAQAEDRQRIVALAPRGGAACPPDRPQSCGA